MYLQSILTENVVFHRYVYYCMKFINDLLSKNIKPVLVFDGCHLPSKKNVEKTRREYVPYMNKGKTKKQK